MSESIAITITNVEQHDEGVRVDCVWRHGAHDPRELSAYQPEWPESDDE